MQISYPIDILKVIFSNKRKESIYTKGQITKIDLNGEIIYQISYFTDKQVFHKNVNDIKAEIINDILSNYFFQAEVFTKEYIYGYRITSKGKVLTNKRLNNQEILVSNHNKEKKYLIKEGTIVLPLIDLGVMNNEGFVVKKYFDKFKQINRFLEVIEDEVKNEKKLNIIDFGCGKSYLTFVLYYYLYYIKKIDVKIIGLDLKEDVINNCNQIKDKYGYSNLSFELGDISLYKPKEDVDMIISLHACDTATDYALYHAIKLKTKYIFCVPCCQHEINLQLNSSKNHLINQFGILKERYSSILTDSIRANILQYYGYKVQVMEFIDMIHSPKNLLIRAVLTDESKNSKFLDEVEEIINFYKIEQTLFSLIKAPD